MKISRLATILSFALMFTATLWTSEASAVKIDAGKDSFIKLDLLMQAQAQIIEDGNPAGDGMGTDFFLRRMRILFGGQIHKKVKFFMETDNPNMGKNGTYSTTFVQDAWIEFDIEPFLKIDMGMLLVPFTHSFRQSAVSLNTLDYHGALAKYPAGSHKVWRDFGIEFRGTIMDHVIYHLMVLNGIRGDGSDTGANPNDLPRFVARVAYYPWDVEDGYFYGGTYLGKKKILSIGASVDTMPDAFAMPNGSFQTYLGVAGDVYLDYPLNDDMEIVAQVNAMMFDYGEGQLNTGWGFLSEASFRYKGIAPVVQFDYFKNTEDLPENDYMAAKFGVNWYLKGHNANIKFEYGMAKAGSRDGDEFKSIFTVQSQFFF